MKARSAVELYEGLPFDVRKVSDLPTQRPNLWAMPSRGVAPKYQKETAGRAKPYRTSEGKARRCG